MVSDAYIEEKEVDVEDYDAEKVNDEGIDKEDVSEKILMKTSGIGSDGMAVCLYNVYTCNILKSDSNSFNLLTSDFRSFKF